MTTRFLVCAIASVNLLAAAPLQRFDKVTTDAAPFASGGVIHIEGSTGDLNIEGWDQPSVVITATRLLWSNNADHAKRLLEAVTIEKPVVSGTDLTLKTVHQRKTGVQVSYRIRVPRDSRLVIHHGTGAVVVYDVSGDVEATTKIGDILLQLPGSQYSIDAKNKSGGEIYSDFPGSMRYRRLLLGEQLKTEGGMRHLVLRVGIGGITIQKMPAAALAILSPEGQPH